MEEIETTRVSAPQDDGSSVVAVASAVACAAAGSLLAWVISSRGRRRSPVPGQVSAGVLAACAAAVIWSKRRQEAEAAHQLFDHIHEVRDARWLKKHPVAYG